MTLEQVKKKPANELTVKIKTSRKRFDCETRRYLFLVSPRKNFTQTLYKQIK